TCGEGSVKWSGLESVLGLWSDSYFPLSDLSGLRRGGAAAKGLVTAQFVGGNLRRICVLCLFGDGCGYLGFLRIGGIPVPIRLLQFLLELKARLKVDVIVVKVSCLIPCVCVSG
ncbi:unnamed protein product, partial [Brassica oleracea]